MLMIQVNLNVAPASSIMHLPDVGITLAKRIVSEREANGPYADLVDLRSRVKGIGEGRIDGMRPHVTF